MFFTMWIWKNWKNLVLTFQALKNHLKNLFGTIKSKKILSFPRWFIWSILTKSLKGVFSFPNLLKTRFFIFWVGLQIFANWLFFDLLNCAKFEPDWTIDIRYFIRAPPLIFFDSINPPKFKVGTFIKCSIWLKLCIDKYSKFEVSISKKIGATIRFPEGLENTSFNRCLSLLSCSRHSLRNF